MTIPRVDPPKPIPRAAATKTRFCACGIPLNPRNVGDLCVACAKRSKEIEQERAAAAPAARPAAPSTPEKSAPNADPSKARPSKSTVAMIDAWIAERIKGHDSVSIPDLANAAVDHFKLDAKFITQFMLDMLRPMIYDRAQKVVGRGRGHIVAGDAIIDTSPEAIDRRVASVSRFVNWYEHAGKASIKLLAMTKTDLEVAASERRKRGNTELAMAELWTKLAGRMEDDQVVADVWTPEEIEAAHASIMAAIPPEPSHE